ncbi:hypothetical protein [Paracoccus benzoatiresistens]|uniref:Uncharacterized protein n=1 Tax=Paracoccus benzoatiresistens TaxID=2997341 RepID=A0ABT4JC79_9RHOB|nr:hypothetical protein [Paracoccus sp. EF6]MCZ0964091.1 hypothetical protein [Paracoccus sp. EF6]
MTIAKLTLQGMKQIAGEVVAGVDYVLYQAATALEAGPVKSCHSAQLVIGDKMECALVTNYRTTEQGGCEITLRRIAPAA